MTIPHAPTPSEVLDARRQAGLTQERAAGLVHCARRTWIKWERGERAMHPAMWELFNLKSKSLKRNKAA